MGERRLAAIMFTDMVGYSALTQSNEAQAMEVLDRHNRLLRPFFPKFHGSEVKSMGDSFLVEFESALDALNCAVEIQSYLHDYDISSKDAWRITLRVGVHLGDVIHQSGDVFGDAVNIAARIEPLAEHGGVCISEQVYDQVRNKSSQPLVRLGPRDLKNIQFPVEVYKVVMPWEERASPQEERPDFKRIAVLPFASLSADPNDEYFADGLTEELIATMSRIGGMRVIARTSVMGYKGSQKKISDVAKELEVGTVLEGSVRKAGEKVRITVQLIDSGSSEHLWAESYDRELKDVFRIQSEISKTVADSLKVRLTSQEKERVEKEQTSSPEAHTLYLKGRHYFSERTQEDVMKALEYFERAAAVDPSFALAYSGIADCYSILSDYGWMPTKLSLPLAREYSQKALRIDDTLAEAHASYGLTFSVSWEWASAERELKRAIELRPSYAPAYHWYALVLIQTGRAEEAFQTAKTALEVDPYSRVLKLGLGVALYHLVRLKEAMDMFTRLVESAPEFAAARAWKSTVHVLLGEPGPAIEEARTAFQLDGGVHAETNLAWTLAVTGDKEEASKVFEDVKRKATSGEASPALMGGVELALGHHDEGFDLLDRALAEKDSALFAFRDDPWAKQFISDPRWKKIEDHLNSLR